MKKTKKILYIFDFFAPHRGGLETVFFQYIKRLAARGYDVTIMTTRYDSALPEREVVEQDGVSWTVLRGGKKRLSFMVRSFFAGVTLLRQEKFDLIHTTTYAGAIPSSLLWLLFRLPVVLTVHEVFGKLRTVYKWSRAWLYRFFEWLIFQLPYTRYHAVSYYTYNCLRTLYGIPDRRLDVIFNGVDSVRNPSSLTPDIIKKTKEKNHLNNFTNVLYYGHAGASKGLDTLVEAARRLILQRDDLQFIFNVIDSRDSTALKQSLRALNNPRIRVLDGLPIEELVALVGNVDMVVAPSMSEGFGSVHTEASAMGTPLVTTWVGPLPEVVSGKVVFVTPDNVYALEQGILDMIEWKFQKIPAKTFDREESIDKMEDLYQGLKNKI